MHIYIKEKSSLTPVPLSLYQSLQDHQRLCNINKDDLINQYMDVTIGGIP